MLRQRCLLLWHAIELPIVDLLDNVMRILTLNGAADGLRSAEHLEDGSLEFFGEAARAHNARDPVDVIHGDVAGVADCKT